MKEKVKEAINIKLDDEKEVEGSRSRTWQSTFIQRPPARSSSAKDVQSCPLRPSRPPPRAPPPAPLLLPCKALENASLVPLLPCTSFCERHALASRSPAFSLEIAFTALLCPCTRGMQMCPYLCRPRARGCGEDSAEGRRRKTGARAARRARARGRRSEGCERIQCVADCETREGGGGGGGGV